MPELKPKSLTTLRSEAPAAPYNGSEIIHVSQGGVSKGGLLNRGVQTMTGSASVAEGCRTIILNAASGTVTVPSGLNVGTEIEFIKIHASAGTWTGARSGSETFAGATSFTITDQYERQVWTKVTSTRWERKLWSMGALEYEEGTWNPELRSESGAFGPITYNPAPYGIYRRVGDEWRIWVSMRTNSIDVGTASGQVQIPLPSVSANFGAGQGISIPYSSEFGGDTPTSALIIAGTGFISLYYRSTPNGGVTNLDVTDLATGINSNSMRIVGAYIGA